MNRNPKGFWRALERLANGAVMAEWNEALGHDAERTRPYLALVNGLAETYPCRNAFGCGFPHRVEPREPGKWLAIGETDDGCPPFTVKREDLLLFEADTAKLCGNIARALGFEASTSRQVGGVRVLPVGSYGAARSSVYLMFPADASRMARELERLFGIQPDPFLLLTPTGMHCSAEVESALRRQACLHIPMSAALVLGDKGSLAPSSSADALLKEFQRRQADKVAASGNLLKSIHENLEKLTVPVLKNAIPAPDYLIRQDGLRKRAGNHDRTMVSTWRVWFQGKEYSLPPLVGAELVIFLIAKQGREFNASALTEAVRKSSGAGGGKEANAVLFGDEKGEAESSEAKGRVGELHERIDIWGTDMIAKAKVEIIKLQAEVKEYEAAGDFTSSHYQESKRELEAWQKALRQNTKQVGGKLLPKELQKGTFQKKVNLIQKNIRKLLDEYLRQNCRPLYDHLNDKNTLKFGVVNSYQPKPRINWVIEMKKGT